MSKITHYLHHLILISVAVFLLMICLLAYLVIQSPARNGQLVDQTISQDITLIRDNYGIPHIAAKNRFDVYFGLGLAHAQDRLWQMEIARMTGKGRLASLFGKSALNTDHVMRSYNFQQSAHSSYESLPQRTQRLLQAYAKGVNRWMMRDLSWFQLRFPPEFALTLHEPDPWTPQDSLLILKLMHVMLAANGRDEISRLVCSPKVSRPRTCKTFFPTPEI